MKLYLRYKGRYIASVLLLSLLLLTSGVIPALAITWNADTSLLLVTPNITMTILNGSGADELIVHGSSFTVTVAAGDRFTVRSTTLAILNNNGSLNPTCSSSYSELIINGAKTVTVTPDGSGTCTGTTPVPTPTPAPTPSGGGGGGGGGGGPVTPTPTPTPQPQVPAVPTLRVKATPLPNLTLGTLLKLPCPAGKVDVNHACKAVYYYGSDGKRRPFPNDKAYFTWYKDFSAVKEVSPEVMSKIALSKAVTYKPGAKMVKFQTLNKVYAVSSDGKLRWVQTEELAKNFYGSDWNKKIDDISDAFYTNYSFGADIKTKTDYSPDTESSAVGTIDKDMGFSN